MRALALAIAALPLAAAAQSNLNTRYGQVNLEKLHGLDTYQTENGKKVLVDRAIVSKVPWVGSWWAYAYSGSYADSTLPYNGIGYRHRYQSELSPAEKWDKYVGRDSKIQNDKITAYLNAVKNTWNPKAARKAQVLQQVYKLIAANEGNSSYDWRKSDAGSEYTRLTRELEQARKDLDATLTVDTAFEWEALNHGHGSFGAQGWWGHCNAWSAAAVMDPEPVRDVTVGGQSWNVGDLKGLLTEAWMESSSSFFGSRNEVDDDSTARSAPDFKDVTPAAFHIFFADQLGNKDKAFVIDRYTGREVWNQPVRAYQTKLTPLYTFSSGTPQPVSKEIKITKYGGEKPKVTSLGQKDVYPVQATTTIHWLDDGVPEDAVNHAAVNRIDNPTEFADARLIANRYDDQVSLRTLVYVLDLSAPIGDSKAKILGDGEWKHSDPSGMHNHPDFMWQPTGNYGSRRAYENPFVDYDKLVKELLPGAVATGGGGVVVPPAGSIKEYQAIVGVPASIPDVNATGVTVKITVPDDTKIGAAVLTLNITHTYKGDLAITLSHGGVDRVIKKAGEGGSEDNVKGNFDLPVFKGISAKGDWALKIVDGEAQDVGRLNAWSLTISP